MVWLSGALLAAVLSGGSTMPRAQSLADGPIVAAVRAQAPFLKARTASQAPAATSAAPVSRRVAAVFLGVSVGSMAGGAVARAVTGNCHCDEAAGVGMLVGIPVAFVVGGTVMHLLWK